MPYICAAVRPDPANQVRPGREQPHVVDRSASHFFLPCLFLSHFQFLEAQSFPIHLLSYVGFKMIQV